MNNILPSPLKVTTSDSARMPTDKGLSIVTDNEELRSVVTALFASLDIEINDDSPVKLVLSGDDAPSEIGCDESYTLIIRDNVADVKATTRSGLLYGAVSFAELYFAHFSNNKSTIPAAEIEDRPKYAYRGYMLDVSRHFFPIKYLYKTVDALLLHKINVFHIHLTDDQGWRIEIKKYPKLTEIGSKRAETTGDKTPHGGFYTQDEMKDLVKYAMERGVTIVPEIDLPGHFTSALASYPELGCTGATVPVETDFGVKRTILCGGKDGSYRFLTDVFGELIELFPAPYYHIGGDEAFRVNWKSCPHCLAKADELKLDNIYELQTYITNYVVDFLKQHGKRAIVWNETMNGDNVDDSVICQYWSDGNKAPTVTYEMNRGRTVINSHTAPFYLDYPYGRNSLKAIYNADMKLSGAPRAEFFGVEAPLWTEWVATEARADYMAFPRVAALAEVGWSENRDYYAFLRNLDLLYNVYTKLNIKAAPLSVVNPGFFAGKLEIARFYPKNFLRTRKKREAVNDGRLFMQEMKELREIYRKKREARKD